MKVIEETLNLALTHNHYSEFTNEEVLSGVILAVFSLKQEEWWNPEVKKLPTWLR